ncbi:hypothetical protein Nos7524_0482 [Nostoc sp. PCC 7524]|uniref:hypothetical protein n=1 Tax=Nostoc sp. (strain ATCC 29411 / PCC 7524) TaxID=28072 RepID=UPI00029F0AF2|nr:hypothetical protein [Nostoc sp. PCC 7524]AFY46394.1 hypothetical protein Nos7524_0482 [Nostoc sp. PCC 7524]
MTDMLELQDVNIPEIVETLTAIVLSPVILPVADAVKQPLVQTVIKEVIESWEDITVGVNTNVSNGHRETSRYINIQIEQAYGSEGKSEVANDVINLLSDMNADVRSMTNGVADLRLLVPMGLGLLAIRQLWVQGLKLNDIPWYILAWCAFDSFIKLNNVRELPTSNVPQN